MDGCNHSVFETIRQLRKVIHQIKPNIIISFEYHMNMKTIVAALGEKHTKVIISERNDPSKKGGRFGYKQARDILYLMADCLVCQTPDAKQYFHKSVQAKTEVIPNPIKDDLPEPWSDERATYIVNFCRLNPQKNLFLLIDAFEIFSQKHTDFSLKIYGDGELHDELVEYISKKKMNNRICVYPATNDIHNCIRDAYMFVSSSDYEGLSNSMLEAMAMGIPTICTDCSCGGARMVIENEVNGLLVPIKDADALSNAMDKFVSNRQLADGCAEKALALRDRLSIERICAMWKCLL